MSAGITLEPVKMDTPIVQIMVPVNITAQTILGAICGAYENGYSSWFHGHKQKMNLAVGLTVEDFREGGAMTIPDEYWCSYYLIPITPGCSTTLIVDDPDSDDDKQMTATLDLPHIINGCRIMQAQYPSHFNDLLTGNDDANTHDLFLQCCVYGTEIYS